MMPIYMDSYPHQRSWVPSGQCYYPSYDGTPPQVTVDQAKYPMMYGPWSNGSNCGHMTPCYACSNHGNFPGYYSFNPPTSHFTSSPFLYSCGHHPVFTAPYHVHYPFTPHQSIVQPRYGCDNEPQRDYHCCGCPNHICNQRSDIGVKIEEQEPDIARKNDSLVPIKSKDYPYPVMWIPPEYMKGNYEYGRVLESEEADHKNAARNTKSHEDIKSSEKGPRVWNGRFPLDLNSLKPLMHDEDKQRTDNQLNEDKMRQFPYPIIWMPSDDGKEEPQKDERKMNGWFPIDINGLKSLMKGEDEKGRQNQQVEDKRRQFPYPIIWMPSYSEQGQAEKKDKRDTNAASIAEEPLSGFEFIPLKPSENDDSMKKSEAKKNYGGQAKSSQTVENIADQEFNLSKKVEVQRKEDNSDETKKLSDAPSKYAESVAANNPTGTSVRRQLSPQRTSKLPPVCLRVEPLSRKKNGNGSSRSPSPPGSNRRSLEEAKDSPRPSASSSLKKNMRQDTQALDVVMNKSKEVEPAEAERNVVGMADDKNCANKNEDWRSGSQRENSMSLPIDSEEDLFRKSSTKEGDKDSDKFEEDKRVRNVRDLREIPTEASKTSHAAEAADGGGLKMIKSLSDVEAAMRIQSAYRGFEVRRMEPLKKLKQMAKVHEQVAEVRNRIQALEFSSDSQKIERERDVIGEMIMRLLLKLDTIQGLHPSLRDVRKALARELITLQKKLDLLVTRKSKEVTEVSVDPKIDTRSDESMQEMQNKEPGNVENYVETSGDNNFNMKERDQSQLSQSAPSQSQDTSEPSLADEGVHGRCKNEIQELFVAGDLDSQVAELIPNMQLEARAANGVHDAIKTFKTEIEEKNGVHPELKQSVQLPLAAGEKTSSEEIVGETGGVEDEAKVARGSDTLHVDDNLQVNELRELPIELIEEHPAVSKSEEVKLTGKGENEIEDVEMESNMLLGPNLATDADNMRAFEVEIGYKTVATKEPETNLLAVLPLGAIEDEPAVSAFEKPETNLLGELPLGIIEDEPAVSAFGEHERIEAGMDEALCCGEAIDNVATKTTALMEAEDLVKVMSEELPVNAVSEVEEIQPLSLIAEEEKSDVVAIVGERGQEMIDVDHAPSIESAVKNVVTEESKDKREQIWEPEVNGKKEEDVLLDSQCEEAKCLIDKDKAEDELRCEFESTKEDALVVTPTSQKSLDEKDIVIERDKKLIEENAKLREMMEKLMLAGKEQLTVISNLTGRVKDLERKLSGNKNHGRRRYGKTPHRPGTKLFNNPLKDRAANVAL